MKRNMRHILVLLVAAVLLLAAGAMADQLLELPEITETVCEWDANGNLVRETAYDLKGAPAVNTRGFAVAKYTWDEQGNKLVEAYYGLNGQPVDTAFGYASAAYTYMIGHDNVAHVLTEDRYAADGSRADVPGSYSYRIDRWDGETILSSEYFDAQGAYVRPAGGYARTIYSYDRSNDCVTVTKRYYDADGTLLNGPEGGASIVSVYTSRSYLVDEPLMEQVGQNIHPQDRNPEEGEYELLLLSREVFAADGTAVLGTGYWHKQVNSYNNSGKLVRTDYTDAEGNPVLCSQGYASVTHVYDDESRVIETSYYGTDSRLIKSITGYARVTFDYYQDGRKHNEAYYGADEGRLMTTYGYSRDRKSIV